MNWLFWIFVCFSLLFGETLSVGYRVKAENCSSSDETLLKVYCETHQTRINIKMDYINLANEISVLVQFYNEKNGKYNPMFKVPRISWCQLTNGKQNTNMLMKSLVDALKRNSPNLFHTCPYQGITEVSNFTVPQNMISILPVGFYRTTFKIVDESSKSKASMFISLGFEMIN